MYNLVRRVIAHRYPTFKGNEDVLQSGALGYVKAMKSFDPTKGCKFESYAYSCIWNEIKKYFVGEMKEKAEAYELIDEVVEDEAVDDGEWINEIDFKLFYWSLSDFQQKIIDRRLRGDTKEKIAKDLGTSVYEITRAMYELRGKIERGLLDEM